MNLPKVFEEKMKDLLGSEYEAYTACYDEPRHYGLRVNTAKISVEDFLKIAPWPLEPVPWIHNGFYYDGDNIQPSKHPYYFAGLYYLQEPSAMTPASRLPIEPGERVLDLCAAPGGKSTHIAELLRGSGHVFARDLTDNKVDMIEENIDRHGLNNMSAEVWDATVFDADSAGKADILICDLPCSGLGVLGRKKDIRYKMTPESVDELVVLQRQILDTVHTYVKPNGVLVYSTCTIDEAENEDNVRWFIEKHPEFELDKSFAEGTGMKQILPGEHGSDGFFIARFIKSKL